MTSRPQILCGSYALAEKEGVLGVITIRQRVEDVNLLEEEKVDVAMRQQSQGDMANNSHA